MPSGIPLKLAGKRFGRLVAVTPAPSKVYLKGNKVARWYCQCDCGVYKAVLTSSLTYGYSSSCGCLNKERNLSKHPAGAAGLTIIFHTYKANARARNLPFTLTREEFAALTSSLCYYCKAPPSKIAQITDKGRIKRTQYSPEGIAHGRYVYNGIDRLNNSEGYVKANCAPCCTHCNKAKLTKTVSEFADWITRVYKEFVLVYEQKRTTASSA